MKSIKTRIAVGATVLGLGGLTGLALSASHQKGAQPVAAKPLVRTKVITRTIRVTRHSGTPPAGAGPGGRPGATSFGGGSAAAPPVATGSSSVGSAPSSAAAPVTTHSSGAAAGSPSSGSAPVVTHSSGAHGGGGSGSPVVTHTSGGGGEHDGGDHGGD